MVLLGFLTDFTMKNIIDMQCYMEGVGLLTLDNGVYTIERESATIPKFLNRLLGLPVHAQNALFQYFSDIVAELVAQAKHDGTYDMGIMGEFLFWKNLSGIICEFFNTVKCLVAI